MNNQTAALFTLAILILAPRLLAQSPNLLRNGDFSEPGKSAPAHWSLGSPAQPWQLDPPSDATGHKPALTITVRQTHQNQGAVDQKVSGLAKNTPYLLQARVKASTERLALLSVKLHDASGKELKRFMSPANANTDWENLRLAFNSEQAAYVSVLCRFSQTKDELGARVSFADVQLSENKPRAPKRADLYVSPSGKNGAPGTKENPLRLVQEALDRATPGTTVHLAAGTYRERIRFTEGGLPNFPVTLEADPGAILDASSPVELKWQPAADIGPGVYQAPLPSPVITVTVDDKILTILDEKRVDPENVKKVLARGKNPEALGVVPENIYTPDWAWPVIFKKGIGPSGWEGVKGLAMYSEQRKQLLFRLRDNRNPANLKITVAPRLPAITIDGANYCVVRGLTIRYAWQGVLIQHSLASTVENCRIQICDHGVWLCEGADRCTIRFNEISQDPFAGASPALEGSWDNWLAVKEGGFYDRVGIEMRSTAGGHAVHDNFIHDGWDGIEDTGPVGKNQNLDVHHNRIVCLADDGLEPNGAGENCRWHDNWVEGTICGFRIKTVKAGPLYAYRNLFFKNHEDYRCFVPKYPARVYVYHNTSTSKPAITFNKVQGIGVPNYWFMNNLFWCERWWAGGDVKPNWHGEANVFVRRGQRSEWDKLKRLAADLHVDQSSAWVEADPGFMNYEQRDFRLKENSPARGKAADMSKLTGQTLPGYESGQKPDAGALQFGDPLPQIPRKPGTFPVPPAGTTASN